MGILAYLGDGGVTIGSRFEVRNRVMQLSNDGAALLYDVLELFQKLVPHIQDDLLLLWRKVGCCLHARMLLLSQKARRMQS